MKMKAIAATIALAFICAVGIVRGSTLYGVYGSDGSERLISFDSASSGSLIENVAVSGVVGTDTIYNIAFQPSSGLLYGLGGQHLYTINTTTGAATPVGSAFSQAFGGTQTGFGFDPVTGLIHIVASSTQANLVMDPTTGGTTTGTPVAFGTGDVNSGSTAAIGGVGFSNNHAGATSTTMYDLSVSGEVATLATQNENSGILSTIGSSGSGFGGTPVGFTISSGGAAFVALQLNLADPGNTRLYSANLTTGQLTFLDIIGGDDNGYNVKSIASPVSAVPEPLSIALTGFGTIVLTLRRARKLPK
jgi:Domain of unknown function (DUF4394)